MYIEYNFYLLKFIYFYIFLVSFKNINVTLFLITKEIHKKINNSLYKEINRYKCLCFCFVHK